MYFQKHFKQLSCIWLISFILVAWTDEGLQQHVDWIKQGKLNAIYGIDVIRRMQHLLQNYIYVHNKHILVIGSLLPWIEALLLELGVSHITTLEYEPYKTNHTNVTTIDPTEFSNLVLKNNAPMFDAMVSFSSIEHSGLGRYVLENLRYTYIFKIFSKHLVIKFHHFCIFYI